MKKIISIFVGLFIAVVCSAQLVTKVHIYNALMVKFSPNSVGSNLYKVDTDEYLLDITENADGNNLFHELPEVSAKVVSDYAKLGASEVNFVYYSYPYVMIGDPKEEISIDTETSSIRIEAYNNLGKRFKPPYRVGNSFIVKVVK